MLYIVNRIRKYPVFVIPAQAGIRASDFQEYLKITANPNLWIPACAGMTIQKVLI